MKAIRVIPDRSKEEGPILRLPDKSLFLSTSPKKTDVGYQGPLSNKDNYRGSLSSVKP